MEKNEILQELSEKTGKKPEELEKELQQVLEEQKEEMPEDYPEESLRIHALKRFRASYRKQLLSRAEQLTGVIIGSMQKLDMVKNKRATTLEQYRQNPATSITKGLVNENGEPLWWEPPETFQKLQDWQIKQRYEEKEDGPLVKKGVDGSEKRFIGKPMPENDYARTVFGVARVNDKWVKMRLRLRGDNCDAIIPTFTITQFMAFKKQSSTEDFLDLNDSGNVEFKTMKELEDTEAENVLRMFDPISLDQIDNWVNNPKNQDFNAFAVLKVLVTEIVPNVTKTGRQIISVEDDSVELTDDEGNIVPSVGAFLLPHIPLNFPEKAEIWLVGQPSITQDREGKPRKGITGYGVYVPKIYRKSINPEIKSSDW